MKFVLFLDQFVWTGLRNRRLMALRQGHVQILVATDVAARGIDVDDITVVFNYDLPYDGEDYVHRIGRTGRAQAVGDAFTLVTPENAGDIRDIQRFIGAKIPELRLEGFPYQAFTARPAQPAPSPRGYGRPQGQAGHRQGGGWGFRNRGRR